MRRSLFALLISTPVVLLGCEGGADPIPGGESTERQGFTACGESECPPGQYCMQAQTGTCTNGCTSDANCEEGHACQGISDVTGEGTCSEESTGEGEGEGEGNTLQACLDACDRFADCGMQGSDYNDCLNVCPDLSTNQQQTVAQCGAGSCSDALNCLEIDCFNTSDCGAGECVGGSCL